MVLRCRSVPSEARFSARCRQMPGRLEVTMAGELDMVSRRDALQACLPTEAEHVVVDLHDLVFMDCAGYRAFAAARGILELFGGSLELTGARGEPLRLLSLISAAAPAREPDPVPMPVLVSAPVPDPMTDRDPADAPTLVGVMSIDPDEGETCRS
jgi:anti-anti-sigma factor